MHRVLGPVLPLKSTASPPATPPRAASCAVSPSVSRGCGHAHIVMEAQAVIAGAIRVVVKDLLGIVSPIERIAARQTAKTPQQVVPSPLEGAQTQQAATGHRRPNGNESRTGPNSRRGRGPEWRSYPAIWPLPAAPASAGSSADPWRRYHRALGLCRFSRRSSSSRGTLAIRLTPGSNGYSWCRGLCASPCVSLPAKRSICRLSKRPSHQSGGG